MSHSETFICADCQQEAPQHGVTADGLIVCYACCAVRDRADMIATGRTTLYLVTTDERRAMPRSLARRYDPRRYRVTNWPNTLSFPTLGAVHLSRVGGCVDAERRDAWFIGPDGFTWHAVSRGDMDLCRARRTQRRP